MGVFEMVVMVVFIGVAGGVLTETLKKRGAGADKRVLAELQAIRDEIRQLRQQNNDVILNLDNNVSRLDQRLSHIENRSLGAASEETAGLTAGR